MIALDVSDEHSHICLIRRMARSLLEHHSAVAQDIDDVETVVGELCSNATRHAYSEGGEFRVTLEHRGDHLILVVTDQGQGFGPQRLPPV